MMCRNDDTQPFARHGKQYIVVDTRYQGEVKLLLNLAIQLKGMTFLDTVEEDLPKNFLRHLRKRPLTIFKPDQS